jgi:hypothetical protein
MPDPQLTSFIPPFTLMGLGLALFVLSLALGSYSHLFS